MKLLSKIDAHIIRLIVHIELGQLICHSAHHDASNCGGVIRMFVVGRNFLRISSGMIDLNERILKNVFIVLVPKIHPILIVRTTNLLL